jgi:hypothetical protein
LTAYSDARIKILRVAGKPAAFVDHEVTASIRILLHRRGEYFRTTGYLRTVTFNVFIRPVCYAAAGKPAAFAENIIAALIAVLFDAGHDIGT